MSRQVRTVAFGKFWSSPGALPVAAAHAGGAGV